MRETTGIILSGIAYICTGAFLWRIIWRFLLLISAKEHHLTKESLPSYSSLAAIIKAFIDIISLSKLFRLNKLLWFGEWIFHFAFVLVLLRHLRYFLYPVPDWVVSIQPVALYASYALPVSLIYIFIVKLVIEKKGYFSSYNFFLLIVIFIISITGVWMKDFIRTDIVEIKHFILSMLIFEPASVPKGILFIIHFIIAVILLVTLPAHIFAAPYTLLESRKREEGLNFMLHEK